MSVRSTRGIGGAKYTINPRIGSETYMDIKAIAEQLGGTPMDVTRAAIELGLDRMYEERDKDSEEWRGGWGVKINGAVSTGCKPVTGTILTPFDMDADIKSLVTKMGSKNAVIGSAVMVGTQVMRREKDRHDRSAVNKWDDVKALVSQYAGLRSINSADTSWSLRPKCYNDVVPLGNALGIKTAHAIRVALRLGLDALKKMDADKLEAIKGLYSNQ